MKKSNHDLSEKDLADGVVSREIVQEIMRYGVSQYQIKKILKLLAFELEDNIMMRKLCDIIEGIEKSTDKKALIIKE
jgi:hypothetical protein